ncbi:hypothetical protein KBD33_00520 [Candidatus Gracilibacteria bacterium]|nr:hypothetical protein [Candidatus Gracilibacteria bacterium]
MDQLTFDKTSGLKDDLNYLLGFSELPYLLSEEIQGKFNRIKKLGDNIRMVYGKNSLRELHEIRDMLYLLPDRIGQILDIAEKEGSVMTFTQLVRDAYAEILVNQYSFSSRTLSPGSQGKDAWVQRREFEPDGQERVTFDRFSDPKRVPRVFNWLDTSKLSED